MKRRATTKTNNPSEQSYKRKEAEVRRYLYGHRRPRLVDRAQAQSL